VLTVSCSQIARFGHVPSDFSSSHWRDSKPLQSLTLVTSGQTNIDPSRSFAAVDLYALIDQRFLGRLRYLNIAKSTEWDRVEDGAELGALELLLEELDREAWVEKRWHYEKTAQGTEMTYEQFIKETSMGRKMRARMVVLTNQ
jgi:hypothetical protein